MAIDCLFWDRARVSLKISASVITTECFFWENANEEENNSFEVIANDSFSGYVWFIHGQKKNF